MKLVIFGLTISSSWGNGHATLWRGLCKAFKARGHEVVFFEHDVPYYAQHRDLNQVQGAELVLYSNWEQILPHACEEIADADVGMVTSYCPDGIAASELILDSSVPLRVFYDLDTPVTLSHLRSGKSVAYIGPRGLQDFDLALSYTGGGALEALQNELGAVRVMPLYGSVDPTFHRPMRSVPEFRAHFSYLGTYAEDRQEALKRLFIEPARQLPQKKFLIGGALYPESFPWSQNIFFARHVEPAQHPAFFCSSPLTLNITRGAMASMGYCPSGRLFEAAACGAPSISDWWEGLDEFFAPGREILVAERTEDVLNALSLSDGELRRIGEGARERALSDHTADRRALEMEQAFERALQAVAKPAEAMDF